MNWRAVTLYAGGGWVWGSAWAILVRPDPSLAAIVIFWISVIVLGMALDRLARFLWP